MAVMIGIDPHKASHTAAAIDKTEKVLGELTVRSGANQVERLVGWASQFEERTWAVEGAGGLGYLLAQQLVAAGEHVVDVQPKLARGYEQERPERCTIGGDRGAAVIKSGRSPRRGSHRSDEGVVQASPRSRFAPHQAGLSPACGAVRARPWWLLR